MAPADGSSIRGTNVRAAAAKLRGAGAAKVHARIASQPARWFRFFGMDFRRGAGGLRRMRGRSGQGRGGRRRGHVPSRSSQGL